MDKTDWSVVEKQVYLSSDVEGSGGSGMLLKKNNNYAGKDHTTFYLVKVVASWQDPEQKAKREREAGIVD